MVLANLQFAVAVAQVEAVALAIAPHLALGALVFLHPLAVAIHLVLVLPDVPEAVLVDVALMVVAADAEASRDGAVGQDGGDVDAGAARVEVVAYLALVGPQKAVAAVVGTDPAFATGGLDELHHLHELLVAELEVGLVGGTAEGKHGEEPPAADAQRDEVVAELRQVLDGALVDAGDDVPGEAGVLLHGLHGDEHVLEAVGVAPHPVVVVLEAVEADGDRLQAGVDISVEQLGGEQHAVAHHAPHEALLGDLPAAFGQVLPDGGLASGGDDHHLARVHVCLDLIEHLGEVGKGHVVLLGEHAAVAAAVAAVEVAAQGAFPEQLMELMLLDAVLEDGVVDLEQQPFVKADLLTLCRSHCRVR